MYFLQHPRISYRNWTRERGKKLNIAVNTAKVKSEHYSLSRSKVCFWELPILRTLTIWMICFHLAFMPKISKCSSATDKRNKSLHINRAPSSCSQPLFHTNLWTSQPAWMGYGGAPGMLVGQAALFPIMDAGDLALPSPPCCWLPSTLPLLRISQSGQQRQSLWPLPGTSTVKAGRSAWGKSWMRQKTAGKYFISTGSQTETRGSSLQYKSISSGYIHHKWKGSNFKSKYIKHRLCIINIIMKVIQVLGVLK